MNNNSNQLPIDPMLAKPSRYDASSAIAVVRKLVLAAPADITPKSRAALDAASTEATALHGVVTERERLLPTRPLANAHVNAWSALFGRLEAAARLPVATYPVAATAQKLLETYFHGGLSFVVAGHEELWVDAERRIGRFDSEGVSADLESIAGPSYLENLRTTHTSLGEALGLAHAARPIPDGTALQDQITKTSRAISRYALALMSEVDVDDDASVERFQHAVAALVAHRASFKAQGDSTVVADGTPTPGSPTTPAPSATGTTPVAA